MRSLAFVAAILLAASCASTPAGPKRGEASSTSDVRFHNGSFHLAGTLHVPRDGGIRSPAVVLVHGSGPQSREAKLTGQLYLGFGFPIPVFVEIAETLADAGFVVLRYDKRTCGPFNGCAENGYPLTPDIRIGDFVADAVAALDFLAAHPAVDPEWLFVVGHSQGGALVPAILAARPAVRGGVMLAPNHRPVDVILAHQVAVGRELADAFGFTKSRRATMLGPLEAVLHDVQAIRAGTFEGEEAGGAPAAFWRSAMASEDAAPALAASLDRPLLVVAGDYDWNVPRSEAEAWKRTFAATSDRHRVVSLPCVTHALNCISQPNYRMIKSRHIGKHVAPAVTDAILGFLRAESAESTEGS